MFAALIEVGANVGYTVVFALIAIETMGIPVPAETALIGAALLAHRGHMDIGTLTILAATAALYAAEDVESREAGVSAGLSDETGLV